MIFKKMRTCDRFVYAAVAAVAAAAVAKGANGTNDAAFNSAAGAACALLVAFALWDAASKQQHSRRHHRRLRIEEPFHTSPTDTWADDAEAGAAAERPASQVPMFDRALVYCSVFDSTSYKSHGEWGSTQRKTIVTGMPSGSTLNATSGFSARQVRFNTPSAHSLLSFSSDPDLTVVLLVRMNAAPSRDTAYTLFNIIGKDSASKRMDFLHLKCRNLSGSDRWVFELDYIMEDSGVRRKATVTSVSDGVRMPPENLHLVALTRDKGRLELAARALTEDARTIKILSNTSNKASEPPPGGFQNTDLWLNRGQVDQTACALPVGCPALQIDLYVFALFSAKMSENSLTDLHKHYTKIMALLSGGTRCPYPAAVCGSQECAGVAWGDPASVVQMSDACRSRIASYCSTDPSAPVCACWKKGNKDVLSCRLWRAYMESSEGAIVANGKLSAEHISTLKAKYDLVDKSSLDAALSKAETAARTAEGAVKTAALAVSAAAETTKPKAVDKKPAAAAPAPAPAPAQEPPQQQAEPKNSVVRNPYDASAAARTGCARTAARIERLTPPSEAVKPGAGLVNTYDPDAVEAARSGGGARLGNLYRERVGADELERSKVKLTSGDTIGREKERMGGNYRSVWRRGESYSGLRSTDWRYGVRKENWLAGGGGRGSGREGLIGWMRGRLFRD